MEHKKVQKYYVLRNKNRKPIVTSPYIEEIKNAGIEELDTLLEVTCENITIKELDIKNIDILEDLD